MPYQAPPTPGRPAPVQGTGFVNFQRFLDANKTSATAMAQGLNGRLAREEDFARANLTEAEKMFYANLRSAAPGAYTGPNDITSNGLYTTGIHDAEKAVHDADLESTMQGRQVLLAQQYGKAGGYTGGESAFDAALSGAAGAQANAEKVRSPYADLFNAYGDTAKSSANAATQARQQPTQAPTPAHQASPYTPPSYAPQQQAAQAQRQSNHLQNQDHTRGRAGLYDEQPSDGPPAQPTKRRGGFYSTAW